MLASITSEVARAVPVPTLEVPNVPLCAKIEAVTLPVGLFILKTGNVAVVTTLPSPVNDCPHLVKLSDDRAT